MKILISFLLLCSIPLQLQAFDQNELDRDMAMLKGQLYQEDTPKAPSSKEEKAVFDQSKDLKFDDLVGEYFTAEQAGGQTDRVNTRNAGITKDQRKRSR